MIELIAFSTITCSKLNSMVSRISLQENLTDQQKVEIYSELRKYNPKCKFTSKNK